MDQLIKNEVDNLRAKLKETKTEEPDGELFSVWQSAIAMCFYDECKEQGSEMDNAALGKLCNDAARRFLNLLIA